MYVSFDYKCINDSCEVLNVSKFVKKIDMDIQICRCGKPLVRMPPATRTHFRFADSKLKD